MRNFIVAMAIVGTSQTFLNVFKYLQIFALQYLLQFLICGIN